MKFLYSHLLNLKKGITFAIPKEKKGVYNYAYFRCKRLRKY